MFERRNNNHINPINTSQLWLIPSIFYGILKLLYYNKEVNLHHEWVWWLIISLMLSLWFIINWKIKK